MSDDPIQNLLNHADQQRHASPVNAPDLIDRVACAYQKRRAIKRGVFTVCALVMVAGLAIRPNRQQMAQKPDDLNAEIAALRQKIAVQEQMIQRLLQAEQDRRSETQVASLAAALPEEAVIERAASAMVFQADRMLRAGGLVEPAKRSYSQVLVYFPNTYSASVARKRLEQLQQQG